MKASDIFDFPQGHPFAKVFRSSDPPWQWLKHISSGLSGVASFAENKLRREIPRGFVIGPEVYLHQSCSLPSSGCIVGPAFIGENCDIRNGVFIRENVIALKGCVLGNSCEFKNSILLDDVQVPHFNYVGDSILGKGVHLGAGVILANLRFDQNKVKVMDNKTLVCSGLRKLGSLVGDRSEIGCNSTLMPGTILEKDVNVGPLKKISGRYKKGSVTL